MFYREEKEQSKIYKKEYVDGIERVIEKRQKDMEKLRAEYVKDICEDREKYRTAFKEMLGWPLVNH